MEGRLPSAPLPNAKDTTRGRSILVEMLGSAVGNSSFRCKIAALQLQRRDYF